MSDRKSFALARREVPPIIPAGLAAEKLGGKLVGQRFVCAEGHEFELASGISDSWCPKCDSAAEQTVEGMEAAVRQLNPAAEANIFPFQSKALFRVFAPECSADRQETSLRELRLSALHGYSCCNCNKVNARALRREMAKLLSAYLPGWDVSTLVSSLIPCTELELLALSEESSAGEILEVIGKSHAPEAALFALAQIPHFPNQEDRDASLISRFEGIFRRGHLGRHLYGAHTGTVLRILVSRVWWRRGETLPYLPNIAEGTATLNQYLTMKALFGRVNYKYFGLVEFGLGFDMASEMSLLNALVSDQLPSGFWKHTMQDATAYEKDIIGLMLLQMMSKNPYLAVKEAIFEFSIADLARIVSDVWAHHSRNESFLAEHLKGYREWCSQWGCAQK